LDARGKSELITKPVSISIYWLTPMYDTGSSPSQSLKHQARECSREFVRSALEDEIDDDTPDIARVVSKQLAQKNNAPRKS